MKEKDTGIYIYIHILFLACNQHILLIYNITYQFQQFVQPSETLPAVLSLTYQFSSVIINH